MVVESNVHSRHPDRDDRQVRCAVAERIARS
jgi:hypothetical protein